jgi:hypothetical protein
VQSTKSLIVEPKKRDNSPVIHNVTPKLPSFDLNFAKVRERSTSPFMEPKRSMSSNSFIATKDKKADLSDPIEATDFARKEAGEFAGGKVASLSPRP